MRSIVFSAALLLAACNQPAPETASEVAAADAPAGPNNCPVATTSEWRGASASFIIAASANGADCGTAQVTLEFRNGDTVAFSDVYPVNQVMVLNGAESTADLERRLNEWINPPGAGRDSTGDLPEWAAGAQSPISGEFPFYPAEGTDRTAYEALRARDAPMFCFVQGMESEACLIDENGAISQVGVQTFPG